MDEYLNPSNWIGLILNGLTVTDAAIAEGSATLTLYMENGVVYDGPLYAFIDSLDSGEIDHVEIVTM